MTDGSARPIVAFDPEHGLRRVDPESFAVLAGLTDQAPTDPEMQMRLGRSREALTRAGALGPDGSPHQRLEPALRSVRDPSLVCDILVAGPTGVLSHQAWLAEESAVVLAQVDNRSGQLHAAGPSFLPTMFHYLLRLGPRPRLRTDVGPVRVDDATIAGLFVDQADGRAQAAAALAATGSAFGLPWTTSVGGEEPTWRASNMVIRRHDRPGDDEAISLTLVDTPAGLVATDDDPDDDDLVMLTPVDPTTVWTVLSTSLVPGGNGRSS